MSWNSAMSKQCNPNQINLYTIELSIPRFSQTITTLNLADSSIGVQGIEHFSNGLQQNIVINLTTLIHIG